MSNVNYESFTFGGVSSLTHKVVMSEPWHDTAPGIRYDQFDIEGRHGAIYDALNYQDEQKVVPCTLLDLASESAVRQWLRGSGAFTVSCYANRERQAHIFDPIEFARLGWHSLQFDLPLILEPFWYSVDSYVTASGTVENPGDMDSVPLIRIKGSGNCSFTLNGITIGLAFGSSSSTVIIDCKEKTEDYPKKVSIGFEYPVLHPGSNSYTTEGNITKVEFKRRGRWFG